MKKLILLSLLLFAINFQAHGQFNSDTLRRALYKLDKVDELSVVLEIVKKDKSFDPVTMTESIRQSYPAFQKDAPIRVFPYMRENLMLQGLEYERVKSIADGLLKFMKLEDRLSLIYFTSEIPVTAFINPNVLAVSSAAANLMTNDELEAVLAHEISHLIVFPYFKNSVDDNNNKQQRTLELFCDAAAISIISAKGGDPANLITGLDKMLKELIELNAGSDSGTLHPTMQVRKKLIKSLLTEEIRVSSIKTN